MNGRTQENIEKLEERVFVEGEYPAEVPELDAEDTCEKCGGETGSKMVGDEIYNHCSDCGWITH